MENEMVRKPVAAGYFYPDNKEELVKEIKEKFENRKFGPGKPEVNNKKHLIGIVTPHAGYKYSGYVAAHAYYHLAFNGVPKTIVIIGPNHTGFGSSVSVYPKGKWITPLGEIEIDENFAKSIIKHSEFAFADELAHLEEHSIEVQLPFIQYLFGSKAKIVPIVLLDQDKEIAKDLSEAIANSGSDFVIVASSDLNHYEDQETTKKKDEMIMRAIEHLDIDELYRKIRFYNISACGYGAIATLMYVTKKMKGKIKRIKHMTSGDVIDDKSSVVGYGALKAVKPI